MMAFKGNVKTYWLVCREGFAPPDYDDYFNQETTPETTAWLPVSTAMFWNLKNLHAGYLHVEGKCSVDGLAICLLFLAIHFIIRLCTRVFQWPYKTPDCKHAKMLQCYGQKNRQTEIWTQWQERSDPYVSVCFCRRHKKVLGFGSVLYLYIGIYLAQNRKLS